MQLKPRHGLWLCVLFACGPEPQLQSFEYADTAPRVEEGARLGLRLSGVDAAEETVMVQAFVTPALTQRPHLVGTQTVVLAAGDNPQDGSLEWRLDPQVFDLEGACELHFEATLLEQRLRTEPLPFTVTPTLEALSVTFDSPFPGDTAPTVAPADAELRLQIEGRHLGGRRQLTLDIYDHASNRRLEQRLITPEADQLTVPYTIPADFLGGAASGTLRFEVQLATGARQSATLLVQREGIYGCAFFTAAGQRLAPNARVARNTDVELRVYAFGLEGRGASLDLVEHDDVEDDFQARFVTAVLDGIAKDVWTTDFVDDGLFDGVDEYAFTADLGQGLTCESPILEVPQ